MTKTTVLFLLILVIGSIADAQTNKRSTSDNPKMKTIRLHIDGFMKSKSGAV